MNSEVRFERGIRGRRVEGKEDGKIADKQNGERGQGLTYEGNETFTTMRTHTRLQTLTHTHTRTHTCCMLAHDDKAVIASAKFA